MRLIRKKREIIRVRWDEAANTFSQINPKKSGSILESGPPHSQVTFESREARMFLENSEVVGSGPTGPSVLLNLNLRFKRQAAGSRGRTFNVEVLARDDSGAEQAWDLVGTITVLPND